MTHRLAALTTDVFGHIPLTIEPNSQYTVYDEQRISYIYLHRETEDQVDDKPYTPQAQQVGDAVAPAKLYAYIIHDSDKGNQQQPNTCYKGCRQQWQTKRIERRMVIVVNPQIRSKDLHRAIERRACCRDKAEECRVKGVNIVEMYQRHLLAPHQSIEIAQGCEAQNDTKNYCTPTRKEMNEL